MNINTLISKVLTSVVNNQNDEIIFTTSTGDKYRLYHSQDCCENVDIEDINGELTDLVGSPILVAEESTNKDGPNPDGDSFTWTFYRLATQKGWVVIRWYGSSNGYYSESVSFEQIES